MGEGSGVLHPPPSLTLLINITKLSSNDSQQKVTSASGLNKHYFTSRCLSVKKSIVFCWFRLFVFRGFWTRLVDSPSVLVRCYGSFLPNFVRLVAHPRSRCFSHGVDGSLSGCRAAVHTAKTL